MNIAQKTVLITGANRGIGRGLLQEALRRGAKRVYAGTRGTLDIADERVTTLMFDVTDTEQIEQAVRQVGSLDVLINNSGIAPYDDLSDPAVIEQALAVNFFGM
jgi:NAD(P)-dependent dehydrogenase (short-subunit alcohol dehydrogenase family)